MSKLIVENIKKSKNLRNYVFVRDIISIEGDVDIFGGELAPSSLTISNYDKNMILCLLKDNLVTDEVFYYLNQSEQIKVEMVQTRKILSPYKPNYFLRYKIPDTGKIITICCGEYFLIDYYDNKHFGKDINELKKNAVELKMLDNKEVEDE